MSHRPPCQTKAGRTLRQRAYRRNVGNTADAYADISEMVTNILAIYEEATGAEINQGTTWYADAHTIAATLSAGTRPAKGGAPTLSTTQVIGILAALSPSTDWDRNVQLARDMIATGDCSHAYGECIVKARRIRDGEDPTTVLGGRKVRSFYAAILKPNGGHVVVDRHAHATALGVRAPLGDWAAKALDAPGRYAIVSAAYRAAGRQLGIPPCEVQATTWLAFRRQYGGRGGRGYAGSYNGEEF